MIYATSTAFRTALEYRLLERSRDTGVSIERLRRRVMFERVVARLQAVEPGFWVVKGGMALEVRLRDRARLTKDLDLGMRDAVPTGTDLHDRLIEVLGIDSAGDRFIMTVGEAERLGDNGGGDSTWRVRVELTLADRPFGRLQLDVSPRAHELTSTDHVELPNSLDFAGIPATTGEIIDIDRHAAEKLHAMLREFVNRDNSRVRDLVDIVLMVENELLSTTGVATAARQVWEERNQATPPRTLPGLPESWRDRYERLATDHDLDAKSFPNAVQLVEALWTAMFGHHS